MIIDDGHVFAGRYRVLERVDSGTLADLRMAHDLLLDRRVMLKIAREDDETAGGLSSGLFKREAQMAARLEHPHLLPVYDFGLEGESQFLVMRHYTENLREYLCGFRPPTYLPSSTIVDLLRQIASAVDYLHDSGPVIHGNLKPNNIVLETERPGGTYAYISDFGVAALGAREVGTPVYMAPEQMGSEEITAAVDAFSFGLIAFECFAGRSPFESADLLALLAQKIQPTKGLYSARRHRPELPIGVDVVLDRLTRPNPAERYRTTTEAVDELMRAFHSGQSQIRGRVFVCYARADSDYAHALSMQLRRIGVDLWIDQDIAPGDNWDQRVEEALQECSKMILVLSPASVRSENVRDEWSYFLEQGKDVYPLVYRACEVPFRLRRRQYVSSTGDLFGDISQVVDVLAGGVPSRIQGDSGQLPHDGG